MFGKENAVVNIRTQVYNAIKENICDGRYEPGQRLHEIDLAASLNVSRSPVREALRRLAADGPTGAFSCASSPLRTSRRSLTCACFWKATASSARCSS